MAHEHKNQVLLLILRNTRVLFDPRNNQCILPHELQLSIWDLYKLRVDRTKLFNVESHVKPPLFGDFFTASTLFGFLRLCGFLTIGFGGKLDKFREIMERVGAQAISSGDVGYELEFMKGLFVRLILWAGDDEFPPSAQILFSDNFPAAFTQGEDMAVVGDVTIDMLKALAAK